MTYLIALIAPALVAAVAYALNVPLALGAHPWWSQSVILIGLPVGIALAAMLGGLTRLPLVARLVLTAGLAGLSFAVATVGKARFAASYAEDVFGGQMWYFGWIATCALAIAVIATALWPRRVR